jgi:hypothetical protein
MPLASKDGSLIANAMEELARLGILLNDMR